MDTIALSNTACTFSSDKVKAGARSLGFCRCGIARAEAVAEPEAEAYRRWIASGGHASMHYLANNADKRLDPTLLLPGARSIVVLAMSYRPARRLPEGEYQIADYALGADYHDILRQRLRSLSEVITSAATVGNASERTVGNASERCCGSPALPSGIKLCVDTVPLLERYWARQAGLGFIGRNRQLIVPGAGSEVFLAAIVTTAAADSYDAPYGPSRCGTCRRCLDACPTGALSEDNTGTAISFDSGRCLSYQTIESREPQLPPEASATLGDTIYGCDRCQRCCPWNNNAPPATEPAFAPSESLLAMTREQWHTLTPDDYRRLFRGSAVKRAKYEGLMRNISAADKSLKQRSTPSP